MFNRHTAPTPDYIGTEICYLEHTATINVVPYFWQPFGPRATTYSLENVCALSGCIFVRVEFMRGIQLCPPVTCKSNYLMTLAEFAMGRKPVNKKREVTIILRQTLTI